MIIVSYPIFPRKHSCTSLFCAHEFLKITGKDTSFATHAKGLIIYYDRKLGEIIKDSSIKKIDFSSNCDVHMLPDGILAVGNFGIGAPAAGVILEEFIAMDIKNIISIGTAGCLQYLDFGTIVLCQMALRDEGTSYHYIKRSKYAMPSKDMNDMIKKYLENNKICFAFGPSWTIDAPYRETREEIEAYKKQGIITVEMEASALFAIAQCRNVNLSALFVVSDLLAQDGWDPKFHDQKVRKGLWDIFHLARKVLSELPN